MKTEAKIISLLRELRAEGKTMLVSTHNLGSVTTFCDYTVMVKGTVPGKRADRHHFYSREPELAFSGVLRHVTLKGSEESIITDDERPLCGLSTISGAEGRKMNVLLEPFSYEYMLNAMWVAAMVGGLCAFLSCYLMLKGWSLIGDALSHSIVPGVAGGIYAGASVFSGGPSFPVDWLRAACCFLTNALA